MSTGQLAGGVAGGIAGALLIGSGVGIAGGVIIGGLLAGLSSAQKTVIEVGKKSDRTFQGSEYGGDIPRVYGTVALSGSQIVWMEKNQLKEHVKKKSSGGKGGASTVTETYSYFATFALKLCQGEIAGIRRIWCSDKLIYNAGSDDLETIIASNQAAKGWRLYRGTDDQLPDPRYEADVGVGNAPAFRGYTYIVFDDFALADYSNTLQAAQFKVEVVSDISYDTPTVSAFAASEDIVHPIFKAGSSLASVRTYNGQAADSTWEIYEHYLGTTMYVGTLSRTGAMGDTPRRVVGDIDSFQVLTNNAGFLVDGTSYPSSNFGPGWTNFDVVFDDSELRLYVLGRDGSSNRRLVMIDADGNETLSTSIFLKSIALGGGYLWGITNTTLEKIDLESLAVISTISISPTNALPAGDATYISYADGLIYLFPYMATSDPSSKALMAFDVVTGEELVMEPNFPDIDYVVSKGAPAAIYDGVIFQCGLGGANEGIRFLTYARVISNTLTLGDVVRAEMELSVLIQPTDIDVSLLTDQLIGYRVSGGTIRSVIEPLQGAYPFDVVPSGYKIKCVPRGQSSVILIPWEDLAATDGSDIGDSLPYSREMDSQLPQKVTVTGLSADREYASSTQSYERLNTSAVNVEQRDIPLVLTDDQIAQMAEKLLFLRWMERDDFDFSLPPLYLALEPADVITIQAKFGIFELRTTEVNYESDGRLACKAKLNNAALYTSSAVGSSAPNPPGTIGISGPTLWIPLDIPVVNETIQNTVGTGTAAVGFTEKWPGAVLVSSSDGGQTYSEIQGYNGYSPIATAIGKLAANSCALIDQSSLLLDFLDGEPESITLEQMIAGVNYAAYGADGRWEIVRFQNAALQPNGKYLLSSFVRGDKGTEWATGLHQPGDYFVLLDDPDNLFIGLPVESIGLERLYRAVTVGASIDSVYDRAFTYEAVNLTPLSPVYPRGARNGSGDLTAQWTRRSRLSSTWWWTGIVAPIGETSESFEVDVMSGSTVKRTISSTSPTITYTAADQVTDFGSAQAAITLRIYQLSTTVGRGRPLEVTL